MCTAVGGGGGGVGKKGGLSEVLKIELDDCSPLAPSSAGTKRCTMYRDKSVSHYA